VIRIAYIKYFQMNYKKLKTTTALSAIAGSILFYHASIAEAQATTSTAVLTVSASIASSCTITTTGLSFGTYASGAATTGSATITATCTNGTAYTILFNEASDGTTAGTYRIYSAGTVSATSSLFLEASFGSTSGFTSKITDTLNAITGTGNGSAQTITLYGNLASGQTGKVATAFSRNLTLNLVYN
jgi:spore coat protein U-like protein